MHAHLDRLRRIALTGLAFVFFFLGGALLSYLVLPLSRFRPGTRTEKARRCRLIVARAWVLFHDYMRVVRILCYDPRVTRFDLPGGPFVLVANHPTLVDVTALVSKLPDTVIVAKSILFRSPLIGRLLRYCDHIRAGDGPFGGAAVVEQALVHLSQGTSVLIFPEGTRSPRHGLQPLRPGAFEIAARAGVPVVAALIRCEPPTLMRGDPWYAVPERAANLTVEQMPTLTPTIEDAGTQASTLEANWLRLVTAAPEARC